jgi:hypothetical protein
MRRAAGDSPDPSFALWEQPLASWPAAAMRAAVPA